jgi:hypothetical protein
VTGDEAFQAHRMAGEFNKRLEQMKRMQGSSLEAALKSAKTVMRLFEFI